jgi:hypothetical protein
VQFDIKMRVCTPTCATENEVNRKNVQKSIFARVGLFDCCPERILQHVVVRRNEMQLLKLLKIVHNAAMREVFRHNDVKPLRSHHHAYTFIAYTERVGREKYPMLSAKNSMR